MDERRHKTANEEVTALDRYGEKVDLAEKATRDATLKMANLAKFETNEQGEEEVTFDSSSMFDCMHQFLHARQEYCMQSTKFADQSNSLCEKLLKEKNLSPSDRVKCEMMQMTVINLRDVRFNQMEDCILNMFFLVLFRILVRDSHGIESMRNTMNTLLPAIAQFREAMKGKEKDAEDVRKIVEGLWSDLKDRGVIV